MVQFKWQRLPGHRTLKGRAGHTATLVGKKIYVFGGRNGNLFYNDVWVFDTETEQWKLLQAHASISARAYHTATLIRDCELWIIGGSDKMNMYGDVHIFNLKTLEWKTPTTTGALSGRVIATHAAVVHPLHSNAILVYGGYSGVDSVWLNDLAILHTDALEWEILKPKGPSPSARGYHTMSSVGHNVVLYGGKNDHGIISGDDNLHIYDSDTNKWKQMDSVEVKGTAPLQRSNHAASLIGENLIVIHGGRNGSERLKDTSALRVSSGVLGQVRLTWHVFPQEPNPKPRGRKRTDDAAAEALSKNNPGGRAAHSLIARDDSLHLFGGYGGSGVTFDDLYVLRNFSEVTGLGDVEEGVPMIARRNTNRRFSFPVEEIPGPIIEGWRSTKKLKRPAAGTLDYKLVSKSRDAVPASREVTELTETPPLEKDFLKVKEQVNELVTKSRSYGAERLNELEVHRREVASLQQTVAALTGEIRAKSAGETDTRERNAVLEHNLEVHRQQVSSLNEKLERLTAENASLKSGFHVLETQKSDRTRERSDMVSKIASLEEKYVDRDRELSKTVQMLGTAETKVAEKGRLLEEAEKEKKAAVAECSEHRMKAHKLEVELRNLEQARESHDKEKSALHNQLAEAKTKLERVAGELVAVKESSRTLQETVERLAKQLERENARADAMERDRDELRRANAALSTEISQITSSRESAESAAELVRSELRTARVLLERSETENGRLQEAAENAREHFATQHATMRKYEEDAKALRDESERWRKLVSEMEEFAQVQARTFQNHLEKIRIARHM